jgi:hypothetical protein
MTLLDGVKVPPSEIQERIWWHNIHRLRMWSTVGAHEENGIYAVLGARHGTYVTNCTDWDYVQVRDFEVLRNIYNEEIKSIENDQDKIIELVKHYGNELKYKLGLHWVYMDADQSKYTYDLYNETLNLNATYYRMPENV